MKKKIIVLGIIILLIGVIAPQSGAVQELAEQQNIVQAPLEEETYKFPVTRFHLNHDREELNFESGPNSLFGETNAIHFNVKMNGTITKDYCFFESVLGSYFRHVSLEEGDTITIECPIFIQWINRGYNPPPIEEQDICGTGLFATVKVVRAPED